MVLSDLGTKGGLVTDPHSRVRTTRFWKSFYAVGNSAASLTGRYCPDRAFRWTTIAFAARAVAELVARAGK
ncbi:hypothetical protein GCM10027360_18600 [Amycolatopsis echigonensis]